MDVRATGVADRDGTVELFGVVDCIRDALLDATKVGSGAIPLATWNEAPATAFGPGCIWTLPGMGRETPVMGAGRIRPGELSFDGGGAACGTGLIGGPTVGLIVGSRAGGSGVPGLGAGMAFRKSSSFGIFPFTPGSCINSIFEPSISTTSVEADDDSSNVDPFSNLSRAMTALDGEETVEIAVRGACDKF
jgi:hypothetical protein